MRTADNPSKGPPATPSAGGARQATRRARRGRRLAAALVDVAMASVLALALANLTGRWFSARAFVALAPGSPNSLWGGPVAYVLGIFGSVVYGAPFALTLVTLAEPLFGASPGKQLLRLRIASRDGTPARRSRLFLRWTVQYVGTWGLVASFAFGSGGGASAAALAGLVVLAGALWVCAPGGLTLHDRISHTLVLS